MEKMKLLLIGGTGTISSAVTRRIAQSPDWDVYLFNRGQRKMDIPQNVTVIRGDISDDAAAAKLLEEGKIAEIPVRTFVSGVSAGIVNGVPMLDLQYYEDSRADVDLNCVMDGNGGIIELQGTGEGRPFTLEEQQRLLELCGHGNKLLQSRQREVLGELV